MIRNSRRRDAAIFEALSAECAQLMVANSEPQLKPVPARPRERLARIDITSGQGCDRLHDGRRDRSARIGAPAVHPLQATLRRADFDVDAGRLSSWQTVFGRARNRDRQRIGAEQRRGLRPTGHNGENVSVARRFRK